MSVDWDADALYFNFQLSKELLKDIMKAFRLPKYLITEAMFPKKKKKRNDAKKTKDRSVMMNDERRSNRIIRRP